jgi:hypothetical protein
VYETRNLAGRELDVDPLLELADGAHLPIGAQELVAT